MKNINYKFIIITIIIIVISIVIITYYKNNNSFEKILFNEKYEIDKSLLKEPTNDSISIELILQKLDSTIQGKELSIISKIEVFNFKRYVYLAYIKDYEKAHQYADSSIAVLTGENQKKYSEYYISSYLYKGDVFYSQEKFNEAFFYYYKARELGSKLFNNCHNSQYSYRIAMIYYKQELFEEAKDNFIDAFEYSNNCTVNLENYYRRQEILSNIGLSYFKLKDYKNASLYYNKAIDFILLNSKKFPEEQRMHNEALGVVYGNLGRVYMQEKKYDKSKSMLKKDLAINLIKGNNLEHAQLSYLSLTEILLKENKLDSAFIALNFLENSLDSLNKNNEIAIWNKLMYTYYEKQNNISKSFYHLKQYQTKNEEWLKNKSPKTNVDLKKQYDLFQKEHKLEILESKNKLKNLYLFITIVIVTLILFLLIFIGLSWKKSKKNLKKMSKLNNTILSQNKKLENAFTIISQKTKEKEKLISLVAHDLRAPIASLSLMVDLLQNEKNDTEKNEIVSLMKLASNNALDLISDTLNNYKKNTETDKKNSIVINDLVLECAAILKIIADEKNIEIKVNLPDEKIIANLNVEKIKRVINNLVVNAIKFSAKETTIIITVQKIQEKILFLIEDQGIGIKKSMIEKIFELESSEYKRNGNDGEQSFGLGLPFCKQVVEEHHGKIWLESTLGKGTTFFVEIPFKN